MPIQEIIILIVFLLLSGFFSSAETALFTISRAKAIHMAKGGSKVDFLIKKMKDDQHRLLSTILIGNTLVNIAASSLATAVMIKIFSENAVGIATGVMTFMILVFGEIMPKSVAAKNNIFIARLSIIPIFWISIFLYPIIKILDFIPRLTGRMKSAHPTVTEEELITIVEMGEEEGEIREEEKELIQNIFEFDDTRASEIMTPRGDMFAIDIEKTADLMNILKAGFSRVPVYKGTIDNIIGTIHVSDLFRQQATCPGEINIEVILRKPYFIPENKTINTLLHQFKKRRHHMAIVIDEYGGVSGLITLEDVIEELVGDIEDETDQEIPDIVQTKNNEWIIQGGVSIYDANKAFDLNIEENGEYDTFSGFILEKIGRIPREKEKISLGKYLAIVKEKEGNRIREFILKKND